MLGWFSSKKKKLTPEQEREVERIDAIYKDYVQTQANIVKNGGYYLFVDGEWGPCAHVMKANEEKYKTLTKVPDEFANFQDPVFSRLQFFCATILYKDENNVYKRLNWSFPWCILKSDRNAAGYMQHDDESMEDFITSIILGRMFQLWMFLLNDATRIFAWGVFCDIINPWKFFENLKFKNENFFSNLLKHHLKQDFRPILLKIGCHESKDKDSDKGPALSCKNTGDKPQFNDKQEPCRIFQNLAHLWSEKTLEKISGTKKDEIKNTCMIKWYQQVEEMNALSDFLSDSGYMHSTFEQKCNESTGKSMAVYCQGDVQLMLNLFIDWQRTEPFTQGHFETLILPEVYKEMFDPVKQFLQDSYKFKWADADQKSCVLFLDELKKSELAQYIQPSRGHKTGDTRSLTAEGSKDSTQAGPNHKKKQKKDKPRQRRFIADRTPINPQHIELANIYCVDVTKLFPPLHQTIATPSEQLFDAYYKHVL